MRSPASIEEALQAHPTGAQVKVELNALEEKLLRRIDERIDSVYEAIAELRQDVDIAIKAYMTKENENA